MPRPTVLLPVPRPAFRPDSDEGLVTAEIATALPGLALLLGIALASVATVAAHIMCVDAARIGARALARGDSSASAHALASGAAPETADIRLSVDGGYARVSVSAPVRLGSGPRLPFIVRGDAATPLEPRS
ncbi:TadE family type IV pilus minor pilin [Marinactinospora thermotolerans]|uniref:TadE-like protein n=1 Tax=Marinactinospora thermotolerans DSM 45154 TaxID=1122192 RepID=A0A1T4T2P8_9ACTN|nr:TadE family type IV pilus minor pilin [Marinactinospora thermotolerans]SKA34579.1 hypothetical protein SAMN02745673_04321 [Marinactinospora thermotolerans DSM 45154]